MGKPTKRRPAYAVCVKNEGCAASLERRKLYRVTQPAPNDPASMLRVIDESGEGYLYPARWFVPMDLPPKVRKALATA